LNEADNRRLDSWKEIADYLDRDVRTVIRWEKEKALPVHRVPGGKRQAVFAYSRAIDEWMLGQAPAAADQPPLNRPETDAPLAPPAAESRTPVPRHRIALVAATGLLLLVAGAGLWIERTPSAAAGPQPLERPLRFARSDYEASAPRGLASGDFNGDKRVDLAFTDSLKGNVVVLLGDGYGAFPRRVVSPTALKNPEHIVVGDFNGDGLPDIALTSYFGGTEVEVLLGNGDGSFRKHFRYDVGGRSRWVEAGDLNGDGRLDLVVASSTAGQIIVLFGNGDGTFREGGRYEAERDVAALALADLNGDGALDIIASDYRQAAGKSVSVYLNAGDGTFRPRKSFPAGAGPLGLAVADLNHDGRLDVVTANFPEKSAILLGTGSAGFAEPSFFNAGRGNGFIKIADLDRDGTLDLLVLGEHSNTVSLLLGDGRGGVQFSQDIATGDYPDGAVVADFDGDQKQDFAVLNIEGNSISVFLNRTEPVSLRRWFARRTSTTTH
jgi:hypothetical protein